MKLSERELFFAKVLRDPVKFAEYCFGWKAYDYQALMLRNTSRRRISRMGRRAGKTDTLAVYAIWYAFTHGNDPEDPAARPAVVLIAAPYENQVKLIFRRIRELISKSPEIQSSIVANTRHPEYIEFGNGACIAGFTSGTKAGAQGASVRGQRADVLIVDEMDYMTDEDATTIIAIAADKTTDTVVWLSSTPTGRRGAFYNYCMDAQQDPVVPPGVYNKGEIWTEFYFPSYCSPGWQEDPEKNEKEWKLLLGEAAYEREILAEFGRETVGVFDKRFIDRAKHDYMYSLHPSGDKSRVMAVDWDKFQSTPTLMCMEYDPDMVNSSGGRGMFKVINRIEIPPSEFTLHDSVNKIIEWNGLYHPDWIYVDRGVSEYQVEELHKRGQEAEPGDPAWGLDKNVVGIHFSEFRDIMDPVTKETVKKPLKPWMINQTILLLEQDRIAISKHDEVLWKQLENYRVEKVSVTGQPRFTSVNEHSVDTLCMCVLAFVEKMPELTKTVHTVELVKAMAVTRPLYDPKINIRRGAHPQEYEQEQFISRSVKENNTQTWFRVDSPKDRYLYQLRYGRDINWRRKKSLFPPRGMIRGHTRRKSF